MNFLYNLFSEQDVDELSKIKWIFSSVVCWFNDLFAL